MSVYFFNEQVSFKHPNKNKIKRWLKDICLSHSHTLGDVNYIFVSDDYLLDINIKFLNHHTLTDIITFDYCDESIINGEIYISIDRIKENAILHQVDFENELLRVIAHGILHLNGFKDKSPKERKTMQFQEDLSIQKFYTIQ